MPRVSLAFVTPLLVSGVTCRRRQRAGKGWELPFEFRLGLGQLAADAKPLPAGVGYGVAAPASERMAAHASHAVPRRIRRDFRATVPGTLWPMACCFSLAAPCSKVRTGPRAARLPAGICRPTGVSRTSPTLSLRWPSSASLPMTFAPILMRTAATWGGTRMLPGPLQPWRCFRPGSKGRRDAATQALLSWAEDSLGAGEYVEVPAAELLARWSAASAGNGTGKSDASLLARVLERHGIGMEPDVRFGGPGPAGQAPVVLFRRAAEIIQHPSDAVRGRRDIDSARRGSCSRPTAGSRPLSRTCSSAGSSWRSGLAEDERRRLRAHFMRVLADPPTPAALRKRSEPAS